jgi:hypothetical protein
MRRYFCVILHPSISLFDFLHILSFPLWYVHFPFISRHFFFICLPFYTHFFKFFHVAFIFWNFPSFFILHSFPFMCLSFCFHCAFISFDFAFINFLSFSLVSFGFPFMLYLFTSVYLSFALISSYFLSWFFDFFLHFTFILHSFFQFPFLFAFISVFLDKHGKAWDVFVLSLFLSPSFWLLFAYTILLVFSCLPFRKPCLMLIHLSLFPRSSKKPLFAKVYNAHQEVWSRLEAVRNKHEHALTHPFPFIFSSLFGRQWRAVPFWLYFGTIWP